MVLGSFADLCVDDVGACASFYVRLLELEVIVDQGWYCELGVDGRTLLALVEERHETVPDAADGLARGLLVSFEVDDAQQVAIAAAELGCSFIVPPVRDLGQFHFMVADPNGTVVDVIERVPLTIDDRRRLVALRRRSRGGAR
ncbi:MAG TPA: VOC family protein [Ilumatobacteraceae bacterium]